MQKFTIVSILSALLVLFAGTVSADNKQGILPHHEDFTATASVVSGNIVYLLDRSEGRLHRINMADQGTSETGIANPTALALTSNGVVVVSLPIDVDFNYSRNEQKGYLTVYDRTTLEKIVSYLLPIDPFSVEVSGHFAVVTSGSGQWTPTISVDLNTGKTVSTNNTMFEQARLSGGYDQTVMFAASTLQAPADIYRIAVDQETGKLTVTDSPYHGDKLAPMGDAVYAQGRMVVTDAGGFYSATDLKVTSVTQLSGVLEAATYFKSHVYTALNSNDGFAHIISYSVNKDMKITDEEEVLTLPAEKVLTLFSKVDGLLVVFTLGDSTYIYPIDIN